MGNLEAFKSNTYSQFGEDGILKEVFGRIQSGGVTLNRWCCEFGAWDGLHLSNTARLIIEEGFSAVLIEGDPKRVKALGLNFPQKEVTKISSFVAPYGDKSLESMLSKTDIPLDFDLLSIDIDGMDYFILASIKNYKPKVIIIEFNPTVPNSVRFIQENNPSIKHGASALAITELSETLGYVVVAATFCNLVLVRADISGLVTTTKSGLDELIPHGKEGTYIFSGYDGTLLSNRPSIDFMWHSLTVNLPEVQVIPKFLRKFPGDFSFFDHVLWIAFRVVRTVFHSPGSFLRKASGVLKKNAVSQGPKGTSVK